jgi:Flp pilus assembly protein TadB
MEKARGYARSNQQAGVDMSTWVWIVIAIAAVVVVAIAYLASKRAAERREEHRVEARGLREQAEARSRQAEKRSAEAERLAERARADRKEAQLVGQRANELDPDVDN